jgi:RNA binding exosome subunit
MATTHCFSREEAILSLIITVFVHGTEDESKVLTALRLIVPENLRVDRQQLKGHFGNAIVVLKARTQEAQTICQIIDIIRCKLSRPDLMLLQEQPPQQVGERSTVVFKFNKQAAARGILELGGKDPIVVRAKIATHPKNASIC